MQLTIFDYLPQNERQSEICMQLFKPKRGPRMRAGYAAEAAKAISDRIQSEPIAVELEQVESTPVSSSSVKSVHPEPCRAGKGKVHLVMPGSERALCNFRPGYSSSGWTRSDAKPNCPRCISNNKDLAPQAETNTQALEAEAAELRAKIAEVHEIRLRQKKVLELKRQREQIGKKISEVMGRGFSRTNDEEAAHFQKKYDRASEAIRALEEQIPTIIPATWRWEERLAEIEKELGQGAQDATT